ncbi:MCE family protein [Nocardioides daejeonensis]|uniref:MCE family protein n=1 Tax=Nocardioides daejeonensis TaxID=1046556 RepID=UPI000D74DB38|nr:MlaD family protein [Nocardioides daejeonensis]
MLLTTTIKRQLCIFAVLATVALGLTFFSYAKVPTMFGMGVYDVTVEYADASGLYPKALVTHRGVKVGRVEEMALGDGRTLVTLRIDDDAKIPTDVRAELRSTSAIGEQYVDLVSGTRGGPYLEEGATIPVERTVEMPQITPVLDSLDALLDSVPGRATREVLAAAQEGFGDSGQDVDALVDASTELLDEAQAQIEATSGLIRTLQPVLGTQQQVAADTREYAARMAEFSTELAAGDKDLRGLIEEGAPALDTARGVLADLRPTVPLLLANLTTTGQVLRTYLPNIKQTLVVYPAMVARLQSAVNPRAEQGDVQLDLRAAVNNPPSCTAGYVAVDKRRSPSESSVRDVDPLAHCEGAPSRPSSVRGARNLPCPNSTTRGHLPADCGLRFPSGRWAGDRPVGAYDLAVERSGADAQATGADSSDGWKALVMAPLELGR